MNTTPYRSIPLAPPRRRYEFAAVAGFIFAPALYCTTLIYPSAAIADLWLLDADDFRAKYAGINVSTLQPTDEGWYVRYRHENLTYLFGPLPDREAARHALWEMEDVREAALKNRPSLGSSQVDYVRFTYSNVYGKAGDTPYQGGAGPDGKGTDGDKDGTGANGPDGAGSGKDGGADGRGAQGQAGQPGGDGDRAGLAGDANGGADTGGREPGTASGAGDRGTGSTAGERGTASSGGERGSRGQAGGQNGGAGAAQQASGANTASSSGTSAGGGGQGQGSANGSLQPAAGGMPGSSGQSGGGGNPLQLLGLLLRRILGI